MLVTQPLDAIADWYCIRGGKGTQTRSGEQVPRFRAQQNSRVSPILSPPHLEETIDIRLIIVT